MGHDAVDWSKIKHFKRSEFVCKCGCGTELMDQNFVELLDLIRSKYGKGLTITSGYRCPAHNAHVSKTGRDGPHTTGKAVDIRAYGSEVLALIEIAKRAGIQGFGLKQHGPLASRYIHVDTIDNATNSPRPWVWTYPQ